METSAGGTLLYIANHLSYKCHSDLNIYKKMNWNLLLLKLSTQGTQICQPKFDLENFILDYFSVDWEDLLKIDELNVDNSTTIYLDETNMLLDTYAPLKKNQ